MRDVDSCAARGHRPHSHLNIPPHVWLDQYVGFFFLAGFQHMRAAAGSRIILRMH